MAENKGEKSELAKNEESILAFWNKNRIFEKSEEKPAPKGDFVFYDGPPFATGLPHYGHILAGTIKDAIPRYRTMCGYRVRRKWGWDCHGLPLENEIEKELNLKTKKDIEELGVGVFNEAARKAVLRYADDWKEIVPRLGRWVNMEDDYKTMDTSYTETVWWIFKKLYEKGNIYTGFKSMHLCPRCGTTLSNFEVNLGYKDTEDLAVAIKLPLVEEKDTSLLVWTTTAWTLPGNMAAAVNKDAIYAKVQVGDEYIVLAKDRIDFIERPHRVLEEFPGSELLGKKYIPPFNYFVDADLKGKDKAWSIYHAPYVSLEEGTGAVHLAPAFGEDDMELAKQEGIPIVHHVASDGRFADEVTDFAGLLVKPKEDPTQTDVKVAAHLDNTGRLFKQEKITHSYPFCWRCETPLLNYAAESWFVNVSAFRDKLVSQNRRIRWVPKEVGERRFGHWLENARDWAISRARYWGAPLPVWRNETTGKHIVIGSLGELKRYIKKSGNRYFVIRHGESELNVQGLINSDRTVPNALTQQGKKEIENTALKLERKKIDLIIHSPLERTTQTAHLLAEKLGIDSRNVFADDRIHEVTFGEFEGKSIKEYRAFFDSAYEKLTKRPQNGETWNDVRLRVSEFLYDLERTHAHKNILIVSHNGPLKMLAAGAYGLNEKENVTSIAEERFDLGTGEMREIHFIPLPHNKNYELDVHRPYIDEIELVEGNALLRRIPDVFDCWFESGSMPYGQHHYPFENTDVFNPQGGWFRKPKGYPADFIAEGLDQTRGWFYSLLVLGAALFGKAPYKNVIVNGLVLAEDGRKMSKRLKNYPDPLELVEKYGADSIRYYMLSSSIMRAEDLNFSEQGVAEVSRKLIIRLSNVLSFYELYASQGDEKVGALSSPHVLDKWICARLSETTALITDAMERYELDYASRPLVDFVDDLSTWYIRRSRTRFKQGGEDAVYALRTTRFVLCTCAKLMAPFTPFYAETLFRAVRGEEDPESVHLASWPEQIPTDSALLHDMQQVRHLVALALEKRSAAGIKVRQPLRTLALKDQALLGREELLALIRDEVNVKEVSFDPILDTDIMLDTMLTEELKEEGAVRDLLRRIQDLRKENNLTPHDRAVLVVNADGGARSFLEKHETAIKNGALLSDLVFESVQQGQTITVGAHTFEVLLR
jgi:isoleucyl-tRNA synthetase